MKKSEKKAIITLFVIFLIIAGISLFFGAVFISPGEMGAVFLSKILGYLGIEDKIDFIVWQIRMPRIVLGALIGLMLAVSGTILQGVLRNPLADPFILGVSAGGAVGAALSFALGIEFIFFGFSSTPVLAFLFASVAVFFVYNLSRVGGRASPETLILAGVALSAFAAAILALIVIFGGNIQSIYFWLLGSLSGAGWGEVVTLLPYALVGFLVAYFYSNDLNALLLGEEMAKTLGIEVEKVRAFLLIIASLLAAATVSVAGIIGFVGLIIPHFVRLIVGPNHRFLIPLSAISGMIILVSADALARVVMAPSEIPIGVMMAIIGSPFFLYLLRRRRLTGK